MVGPNTRYARAMITGGSNPPLVTGRSRPIPDAGGDFDVSIEAVSWVVELRLNPGESVNITVGITQDLGDVAAPAATLATGTIDDPWRGGPRSFPGAPGLSVTVATSLIDPTDAGYLARAKAAGVSGVLVVPQGFIVDFVDIPGLYKPSPPAPPPALGSAHVAGYISDDHKGRIFTNRIPVGTWTSDTQYIEPQVKITAFGGPTIPAGAKIRWIIIDPDDPTNDDSGFHRDWGPYVDANDYSAGPAFTPIGAHDGDNTLAYSPGNADPSKLFGAGKSGNNRWETATGGQAPAPSSPTQADSPLTISADQKSATASVRVHCPNVLGTNLILKAQLINTPAGIPVHQAATGVMTMWSRIDVEVKRMAGAFSMASALPNIPPFFLPACVQLDFQAEVTVAGALDKATVAATEDLEDTGTSAWVNAAFTNKAAPGWFFLGAARLASPLPPGGHHPPIFDGTTYTLGTTGLDCWVQVNGHLAHPSYLKFTWTDGAGNQQSAGFGASSKSFVGTKTRIVLSENDITPLFTGYDADGSLNHATASYRKYFPQHELPPGAGALVPGGFGVPAAGANLKIFRPGAVFTDGISPTLSSGGDDFFGGRTVIFTQTPSHAASFVPEPDDPAVTEIAGAGSFAAGRDVYIRVSLVNGHGETSPSDPFKFPGTTASDQFSVPSPTLTPWHAALAGANAVTGYNVYEADVSAGAAAPPRTSFKKVNAALVPIGTPTLVNNTAAGAAPHFNTAAITPAIAVSDFDSGVLETVVHEFTHAFGMPHKCGYWNWRTPRQKSCCMNYFDTWLVDAAFKLLPNTVGKQGNDMCGRHLMEVRRVHLERNTALKGLGW